MGTLNLLLADDDDDDCLFFKDALEELPISVNLTTAHNGVELMDLLSNDPKKLPDILFLDLNMPLKNGFDCLLEIKSSEHLRNLPVIIFSTSYNPEIAGLLYEKGANYYIKKPSEFSAFIKVIHKALILSEKEGLMQPKIDEFLLQP